MKKVKSLIKRLIISYLIIFIALSSTASTQARMYDAQCGEFLSNYARDFIKKYCEGGNTQYSHVGFVASDGPHWSSGVFGKGTFKADCTNGVHYMYFKALGTDKKGRQNFSRKDALPPKKDNKKKKETKEEKEVK